MWSQWTVILLAALVLFQKSNAQLTSPIDPVCPGNRAIFICQQSVAAVWMINLPSGTIQNTVQSSQIGSVLAFVNDPGYNFELHVVSNSSNILTTELRVTAVRELNGVRVVCAGSETSMSIIQVASIDPPAAPSGVTIMVTSEQFTKTGASVNVTWSTSRGADNYTVNVTPPIMPGQLSDFTTTDTSLLLMLDYNISYSVSITAQNCAGSNSTVYSLSIIGCSPPSPPTNGRINEYHNGSIGASLTFQCNTGYLPHEQVTSTCMANGNWVPIPQCHSILAASAFCSAPAVPTGAHISDQSTGFYPEGTNITIQCDNEPHTALTTVCHADRSWRLLPSELDCSTATSESATATADVKKLLSTSGQLILTGVICSLVFFFLGILVGVLCRPWGRVLIKPCTSDIKRSNGKRHEHPSPTDTPADDAPVVYEEVITDSHSRQKIELEENVAYGHI